MMKAVATAVEPAERAPSQAPVQPLYLEALTLVERLHRRLLDVIKDEFDRRGRADINSVQALLLYNIGDKELTAGAQLAGGQLLVADIIEQQSLHRIDVGAAAAVEFVLDDVKQAAMQPLNQSQSFEIERLHPSLA